MLRSLTPGRLATVLLVAAPACTVGDVGAAHEAITMGTDDAGDDAVVALVRDGAVVCSGTLIAPDVVLTAAHCVDAGAPDAVRFGEVPGPTAHEVAVIDAVAHPDYDRLSLDHDIAVLVLASRVDVTPARLAVPGMLEESGEDVRVAGFGATTDVVGEPAQKRTGDARIASTDAISLMLTAAPSQPCRGDSGGPAFVRVGGDDVVAGVTSSGDAACSTGSRETRVDAHADFLAELVRPRPAGCDVAGTPGSAARNDVAGFALLLAAAWLLTHTRRPSQVSDSKRRSS